MSVLAPALPSPAALRALRDAVEATPLHLEVGGAAEARTIRDQLVGQLDDYVIPRVEDLGARPLVCARLARDVRIRRAAGRAAATDNRG